MAKKKHKARKSSKLTNKGTVVLGRTLGPDCVAYFPKKDDVQYVAEAMSQHLNRHFQIALLQLEQELS